MSLPNDVKGVDFLKHHTDVTFVVHRPLPDPIEPKDLPPPAPEEATATERRAASIRRTMAAGKSRGRQEGFVIPPPEIVAMITRAVNYVRDQPLNKRNPRQTLELILGFTTGVRVTDLVKFTWDQVLNYETFTIHEEKHATRRRKAREAARVKDGKLRRVRTIKPRVVEIPENIRLLIRELYEMTHERFRHEVYVFGKLKRRKYDRTLGKSLGESNEHWTSSSLTHDFKRACERFGTPGVSDTAYYACCRPSSARWRYEIVLESTESHEMALAYVQAILSHKTPEQTMRYLKLHKDPSINEAIKSKFMNFEVEQPTLTSYKEARQGKDPEHRKVKGRKERFTVEDAEPLIEVEQPTPEPQPQPTPEPEKPDLPDLLDELIW